jgi:hypothetical protein
MNGICQRPFNKKLYSDVIIGLERRNWHYNTNFDHSKSAHNFEMVEDKREMSAEPDYTIHDRSID